MLEDRLVMGYKAGRKADERENRAVEAALIALGVFFT